MDTKEAANIKTKYVNAGKAMSDAIAAYNTALADLSVACTRASNAMSYASDDDAVNAIARINARLTTLRSYKTLEGDAELVAEVMEALADEVTADLEHLPAGVS